MSFVAALGGREEDQAAASLTGLRLQRGHQRLPDPTPPMSLVDDDGAQLRRRLVVFNRETRMEARQPDDLSVHLRDDESIGLTFCSRATRRPIAWAEVG